MNQFARFPTTERRFLAAFLDLVFVILLSLFIFIPVEAVSSATGVNDAAVKLYIILYDSGFYEFDEKNVLTFVEHEEHFPKALYTYYVDKESTTPGVFLRGYAPLLVEGHDYNSADDYYDVILKRQDANTLFDFSIPIPDDKKWQVTPKEGSEKAVNAFYQNALDEAFEVFSHHEQVLDLYQTAQTNRFLKIYVTFIIGAFFAIFLFPFLTKRKATLGNMIAGLKLATNEGYKINHTQLFVHQFSNYIFSYMFFFLPFHILNFALGAFGKKKQGIYDYFSKTIMVDEKSSLIFQNREAEMNHVHQVHHTIKNVEQIKAASSAKEEEEKRRK